MKKCKATRNRERRRAAMVRNVRKKKVGGKTDPTGTGSLRLKMLAELRRKFKALQAIIYAKIVDEDALGLVDRPSVESLLGNSEDQPRDDLGRWATDSSERQQLAGDQPFKDTYRVGEHVVKHLTAEGAAKEVAVSKLAAIAGINVPTTRMVEGAVASPGKDVKEAAVASDFVADAKSLDKMSPVEAAQSLATLHKGEIDKHLLFGYLVGADDRDNKGNYLVGDGKLHQIDFALSFKSRGGDWPIKSSSLFEHTSTHVDAKALSNLIDAGPKMAASLRADGKEDWAKGVEQRTAVLKSLVQPAGGVRGWLGGSKPVTWSEVSQAARATTTQPRDDLGDATSVENSFCPTGEGGGVDPSCSPGEKTELSASEVLDKIKASPNLAGKEVDWDKYADRYKVQGEFVRHKVDPSILKDLINSQWLSLVQAKNISEEAVADKRKTGKLNDVIITQRTGGQMLVVDGNHSLVAAIRNANDKPRKKHSINVIFPKGMEKSFGIDPPTTNAYDPEQPRDDHGRFGSIEESRHNLINLAGKSLEGPRDPVSRMGGPDKSKALEGWNNAVHSLPSAVVPLVADNVKSVHFAVSSTALKNVYARETGKEGAFEDIDIGGVMSQDGKMFLLPKTGHGIYEHELAHAIDPGNKHSHSKEWIKAWDREIAYPDKSPMSELARDSPSEGFAEFARAAWAGNIGDVGGIMVGKKGVTPGELEERFPMMSTYFKSRGFFPSSTPGVTNAADQPRFVTNAAEWIAYSSPEKIAAFKVWLQEQTHELLTAQTDREMWERYAEAGFRKGAGRAFSDTKSSKLGQKLDFYKGTKDQFLRDSFAQPVAVDTLKMLAGRSFDDLEGVTDDMSNRISRSLMDGLVQGQGPRQIAKDMAEDVDISRERALTIARTEIIRAHAEGQLTALDKLGVEKVGVAVEFSDTGDDKVCEKCASLSGVVLTIDEARGKIPVHPRCRCAWVPANVGEDDDSQKDTKGQIDAAFDDAGLDIRVSTDRQAIVVDDSPATNATIDPLSTISQEGTALLSLSEFLTSNADDGHWVTLGDDSNNPGQHVYIGAGGEFQPEGPKEKAESIERVGKEKTQKTREKVKEAEVAYRDADERAGSRKVWDEARQGLSREDKDEGDELRRNIIELSGLEYEGHKSEDTSGAIKYAKDRLKELLEKGQNNKDRLQREAKEADVARNAISARATSVGKQEAHGMTWAEDMVQVEEGGIKWKWTTEGDGSAAANAVESIRLFQEYGKTMPKNLVESTKEVIFTRLSNKMDSHWASVYKDFSYSHATGGDGKIVVYQSAVMEAGSFAHESGHNFATRVFGSTDPAPWSGYAKAQVVEKPVSSYGANSPGEDFAEACKMYADVRTRSTLERDFPLKHQVIEGMMGHAY